MNEDYADLRHKMVEWQIRKRGFMDERALAAMERVPRHFFVPERVRHMAYEDMPLPIGQDQTISQPYIVALMVSLLGLKGEERVLEIGTGSGYQAAVLGTLAAEVHTVELVPSLAQNAERVLMELGYYNVHVHIGDGTLGWPEAAPYPAVIVSAAAPHVPAPLCEQLTEGGRLVLPVQQGYEQLLKVYTRRRDDYDERVVAPVAFVPLRGKHGWG